MFEKAKGLRICKEIFGAWGFLLINEQMYLVSHSHVKKTAVKFVIFFCNKYFFIVFILS